LKTSYLEASCKVSDKTAQPKRFERRLFYRLPRGGFLLCLVKRKWRYWVSFLY